MDEWLSSVASGIVWRDVGRGGGTGDGMTKREEILGLKKNKENEEKKQTRRKKERGLSCIR
jgi:hypothetical protein